MMLLLLLLLVLRGRETGRWRRPWSARGPRGGSLPRAEGSGRPRLLSLLLSRAPFADAASAEKQERKKRKKKLKEEGANHFCFLVSFVYSSLSSTRPETKKRMSDPLQFASLTLEDDNDVANRGVITAEPEETAAFAAASSATHGEDNAAIDDEPLAAAAAAAPPAAAAAPFPDEPPPPYESIVMGTASAMVRYLEEE